MAPWTAIAAQDVPSMVLEGATVTKDGQEVVFEDPIRMLDDRLFFPVVHLAELFDAKVEWNQAAEEATILTADGNRIVLGIGVPVIYYNESRYRVDAVPFIEDGRTYIPVRYFADLMHVEVTWNVEEQAAKLQVVPPDQEINTEIFENEAEPFTDDDFMLLAKIAQVEAGKNSYEGQLAVANVVLNRVRNSSFPDTIRDVIYAGKQFPPAHNGILDKSQPNESALRAAKDALNGKNNVKDAIYFYNPKVTSGSFWSGLEVVVTIGAHRFAK